MKNKISDDKLSGSEAIYGFVSWLSTRKEEIKIGSHNVVPPLPELIQLFCDTNNLDKPQERWVKNLTHPNEFKEVKMTGRTNSRKTADAKS